MILNTRNDVLKEIARAAVSGNLGLFAGTGLSNALTNGSAPSFNKLLRKICNELEIDDVFAEDYSGDITGKSYPSIAEDIVELAKDKGGRKAVNLAIRSLCSFKLSDDLTMEQKAAFQNLNPQWIVTTNYDLLLEQIFSKSISIGPKDRFISYSGKIPIYHIHGHIRNPEDIIITEDDYAMLFSPLEYRQLKMATLMSESLTLMIGYSLGDINIKAAINLSNSFNFKETKHRYKYPCVQLVRKKGDVSESVRNKGNIVLIEISTVFDFVSELNAIIDEIRSLETTSIESLKQKIKDEELPLTLTESEFQTLSEEDAIIAVLEDKLASIWTEARKNGGFDYYKDMLKIILYILTNFRLDSTNPVITALVSTRLNSFSNFYGDRQKGTGYAWDATDYWREKASSIPEENYDELYYFAQTNNHYGTIKILKDKNCGYKKMA